MAEKLVIAGGGHASLPVIKMGRKWKEHNLEITLISKNPFLIYSGALPQYMGGFYGWNQTAVDLEDLCGRYGVPFISETVTGIRKDQKMIVSSTGRSYSYDYLLLNLGASSRPIMEGEDISPVKPMSKLLELREKIASGSVKSLLIVGGGAAGSELAMNLSHPNAQEKLQITILEKSKRLLASFPEKLSRKVTGILESRNVDVITGNSAASEPSEEFDHTILAAGNQPESLPVEHSFETGAGGRILTDQKLRVVNDHSVFTAGDIADIGGKNYQQIGVHAVKQGALLRENILAAALNKPLKKYKPYLVNPLILSNGPDDAFYVAGNFVLRGRLFAVLKHVLDMRWMEKYSKQPEERRSAVQLLREGLKRSKR